MDKQTKNIGTLFLLAGIFVSVLCFLLYLPQGNKDAGALERLTRIEESSILAVIKGGVEDNSWWGAKNKADVTLVLSKYYMGKLLEELSEQAWNFVSKPTDWYWQTRVVEIKITNKSEDTALVDADLEILDLITNQKQNGTAQYIIKKTSKGWRIINSLYSWPG